MTYFFTTKAIYKPIGLFSKEHISLLALSFFLQFLILRFTKKDNKWLNKTLTIILILEELFNYYWFTQAGLKVFIARGLPLWHCSIAMILLGISSFNNNEKLMKIGSYWGFIGALCALIYPGSLLNYKFSFPHIVHLSHFTAHLYLLLVSSYNIFVKRIDMTKDDYSLAIQAMITYNLMLFLFNHISGTNYGFVNRLLASSQSMNSIVNLIIVTSWLSFLLIIERFLIKHNKIGR